MTTELGIYSQKKFETRSGDLPTPTLDLFELLTLAEDIHAGPHLPSAKAFTTLIIKKCDRDDVEQILEWAGQIRESRIPDVRAGLAKLIVSELEAMLRERESEIAEVEIAAAV